MGIYFSIWVVMVTLLNILLPQKPRLLGSVIFVVVVITGFITLFISNSFVFVEARRHLRRTEKISCSTENISVEPSDKSNNKEKEIRKKELDRWELTLDFFLFWINLLIVNIKLLGHAKEVKLGVRFGYILGSWYLIQIYYILNPLWYVKLSHDVKREVKQLFRG